MSDHVEPHAVPLRVDGVFEHLLQMGPEPPARGLGRVKGERGVGAVEAPAVERADAGVGDLEPALGVGAERESLLDLAHHGVTARLSR
jgi:hypothetical protein